VVSRSGGSQKGPRHQLKKDKTQQGTNDVKFTPTKHLRINTFQRVNARAEATRHFNPACREKSGGISCNINKVSHRVNL